MSVSSEDLDGKLFCFGTYNNPGFLRIGCVVFVGLGSGCCQTCSFAGGGGAGSGVGTSGGGASGAGRSGNGMSGAAGDGDVLDFLLYFLRS